MTHDEAARMEQAFNYVLEAITRFQKNLSPRDITLLQIGMRASHIEEAMAHWELDRAKAHFEKLMEIARQLVEYDRTHPR